jgi:ribonuclease P protein component
MLSKKNRLNLRLKENLTIFSSSNRFFSKNFGFYFRKVERDFAKVAIVIPKKTAALAVRRNYWRRLLYNNFPRPLLSKGFDIVIVLQKLVFKDRFSLIEEFKTNLEGNVK